MEGPAPARDAHVAGRAGRRQPPVAASNSRKPKPRPNPCRWSSRRGRSPPRLAQVVWDVLADGRAWSSWGAWSSTVYDEVGSPSEDGVGACAASAAGPSPPSSASSCSSRRRASATSCSRGLPIGEYHSVVTLTDVAAGGTEIHWRSEFELRRQRSGWFSGVPRQGAGGRRRGSPARPSAAPASRAPSPRAGRRERSGDESQNPSAWLAALARRPGAVEGPVHERARRVSWPRPSTWPNSCVAPA